MKILIRILLPAALVLLAATAERAAAQEGPRTPAEQAFGAALTIARADAITVGDAIDSASLRDTPVLLGGTIADVCTNKGCWLVVSDGSRQFRVTFKDYGFFVPKDSKGRRVLLEGTVTAKEISEDEARHYAEEASTGPKPEEIHGPQQVITMVADGVVILSE